MKSMIFIITAVLVAVLGVGTVLAAEPSGQQAAAVTSYRSHAAPAAGRHFRLSRKPKKVAKRVPTQPGPRVRNTVR
jgi:hypothetical protein